MKSPTRLVRLCGLLFILAAATAHSNAIDDLAPGVWLEVPDSRLDTLDPEDDPAANPLYPGLAPWRGFEGLTGIMDDWSSAALDTQRDRLVVWGGGHGGYAGNEVYAFDIETLAWERLTDPATVVDANGTTLYDDGTPRARETYNYLEYLPTVDRMVSFGGGNLYPCCNVTTELAAFDFETLSWNTTGRTAHPGSPFQMFGATVSVDTTTGHAWLTQPGNNPVHEYDPVADSWLSHSRNDTLQFRNSVIDQKNRYLIWTGFYDDVVAFDLDRPHFPAVPRFTTGDTEIQSVQFPGLAWDPVSERVIAWGGGASVHALDSDTWTWTRIDPDPANVVTPTAPNSNGTNGRFRYVPSRNAFVLVNHVDENVYFFKLPVPIDSDSDGIDDNADNCVLQANGTLLPDAGGNSQWDTDADGIGNACDADIGMPGDCIVNFTDLGAMKAAFFSADGLPGWNPHADSNGDGSVNFADLDLMKSHFFRNYTVDNPSGVDNDCQP